jgi:hypothetical protein
MRDPRGTAGRGYGSRHQALRKRLAAEVALGATRCARGRDCRFAEGGLGGLILPGETWDLGHDDGDPSRYAGPEHVVCNRSTAGRRETFVDAPERGIYWGPPSEPGGVPRRWSRAWWVWR